MSGSVARSIALAALAAGAVWAQPTITTTSPLPTATIGMFYLQTFTATEGSGACTCTWAATGLPGWLGMNTGGVLSGTPPATATTSTFMVTATDSANNSTSGSFTLPVALTITTTTVPNGVLNVAYPSTTLQAQGGTPPYTWAISSGSLPTGITLSPGGVVGGTPTADGPFSFTAEVTDSSTPTPLIAPQAYSFSILGINTIVVPNGVLNVAYPSTTLKVVGGITPYTWTISAGSLPTGMMLSSAGVIMGTPTAAGPFSFTAKVTDSSSPPLVATQAYSFTILGITTTTVPNGVLNAVYASTTLNALGGTAPYTWTISAGSLPTGLTLSAGGVITGTPTTDGPFSFTAEVTDSSTPTPLIATQAYSFSILGVTTTTVPNGVLNVAYPNTTLKAVGGTAPYTWRISAGSLPTGMTLSSGGVVSGTPTAAGPFSFTAEVTDSSSPPLVDTQAYSATILGITTVTVPDGALNVAYPNTTLKAAGGTIPYTWTISAGSLPAGMTLSSGGVISGTPTADGAFSFTAEVTDSSTPTPLIATQAYSFTILGITTTTVPNGVVNVVYPNTTLKAVGGVTPYTWSISSGGLPAGMTMNSGGVITGTPTAAGGFSFTAKVTDSSPTPLTATQAYSATIATALAITTSALANGAINANYSQALAGTGGLPPYTWSLAAGSTPLPTGLSLSPAGVISGTPTATGTFLFKIQLSDSDANTVIKQFAITIANGLTIVTPSLPNATVGIAYSQTLAAAGGVPPYISWAITSGTLPAALSLNSSTGQISGTPASTASATFTVTVTDSASNTASQLLTLTVVKPPVINTTSLPIGTAGVSYSQTLSASGGTMPYQWTVASGSLPAGLSLSSATGTIGGTPTAAGTASFKVQLTDATGITASQPLTLTVIAGLKILTASLLPTGEVSVAYSQTLGATGGAPPYTWSVTGGALPPGLTLAANGSLTGTPGTAGNFNFTVQASDSNSVTASKSIAVAIAGALTISTPAALNGGSQKVSYSQILAASAGVSPYTWSVVTGPLPTGLSLSAAGVIAGVPTATGTFPFTAQVTDSLGATASRQFTIVIAIGLAISTAPTLPGATVGVAYSETLLASGGAAPYTWALTAGALPAGLTLSAAGAITGAPTATGTFQFTATATDGASDTASQQFTLFVAGGLAIATTALPGGRVGAPYSQTLTATGGTPPYNFATSAGSLPPGITLKDAVLSGTPTSTGSYTFTIQVTDSTSATATEQFTIAITNLDITTSASLAGATVGTTYSQQLAATGGTPPYTWALTGGALPGGLTLSSAGAISGTPNAAGTFQFTATVTDSASSSAPQQFTLVSELSASFSGLSSTAASAQQVSFTLALGTAYAQEITGQVTLSFQPDASLASPADDPSIQFSTGGTAAPITIPPNSTAPVSFSLQTGTVAGTITLTVSWEAGGATLPVPAALTQTIQIAPAVPVISAVTASTTSSGFQVVITGYSNTRELSQALLQFTPATGQTLQTTSLTVSLTSAATTWFQSGTSDQYGSQFTLTLPFTVTNGSASAIGSVSVQLVNSQGNSASASATL